MVGKVVYGKWYNATITKTIENTGVDFTVDISVRENGELFKELISYIERFEYEKI